MTFESLRAIKKVVQFDAGPGDIWKRIQVMMVSQFLGCMNFNLKGKTEFCLSKLYRRLSSISGAIKWRERLT